MIVLTIIGALVVLPIAFVVLDFACEKIARSLSQAIRP